MNTIKTLRDALDEEFPMPDTPHASVATRAIDNRAAFTRGWAAARATEGMEAAPVTAGEIKTGSERYKNRNMQTESDFSPDYFNELEIADLRAALAERDEQFNMLRNTLAIANAALESGNRARALAERGTVGEPVAAPGEAEIDAVLEACSELIDNNDDPFEGVKTYAEGVLNGIDWALGHVETHPLYEPKEPQ